MCVINSFVKSYENKWVPPHYTQKIFFIKHMWRHMSKGKTGLHWLTYCFPWHRSAAYLGVSTTLDNSVCHPANFNFDHICSWPFKVLPMRLKLYIAGAVKKSIYWGSKCWSCTDTLRHNYRMCFTEKPFPFWSVTWHPRSKANKMVHLSHWKFSLGPAPCFAHSFGRFIYPWLIWLFEGAGPTAVNSLSRQENVHDTGLFNFVFGFRYIFCSPIFC